MAKKRQNITLTSRAANQRVEAAVPKFMERFGMQRDQATATALRLESIGRLHGNDGVISRNPKPKGSTKAILKAMSVVAIPKRSKRKTIKQRDTSSLDELQRLYAAPKRVMRPKKIRRTKPRKK